MSANDSEATPPDTAPMASVKGAGTVLLVLGIGLILWGVFHVLGSLQGNEPWPTEFAERKSYNQVKSAVHGSFFGGFVRGFFGLALCIIGMRARERGTGGTEASKERVARVTVRGYVGGPPVEAADAAEAKES